MTHKFALIVRVQLLSRKLSQSQVRAMINAHAPFIILDFIAYNYIGSPFRSRILDSSSINAPFLSYSSIIMRRYARMFLIAESLLKEFRESLLASSADTSIRVIPKLTFCRRPVLHSWKFLLILHAHMYMHFIEKVLADKIFIRVTSIFIAAAVVIPRFILARNFRLCGSRKVHNNLCTI